VILGYSSLYPADEVERLLPGPAEARALLSERRPDIPGRLKAVATRAAGALDAGRHLDATLLGVARLGLRHGHFGADPHAYHCEDHVLELAERRMLRLLDALGPDGPDAQDALALLLFAACHDLRQREIRDVPGPVGGNEAASIAETVRILDVCGFRRDQDRALYLALELMIAASTFDPRPLPHPEGEAMAAVAGGSLARSLGIWLDGTHPEWAADPAVRRGERLGRLAADLDTANVGEDFALLAQSAVRLCQERESRAGRALDQAASGPACLGFLGQGQLSYFFDLHRFCSREGDQVFGPAKQRNGPRVRRVSEALQSRFQEVAPASGQAVISAFLELSGPEPA
jgi:hypothetical protein